MNPDFIDWNSIPDTISKDSFCKICHMSKRTATKFLGTMIPCSDNGKKTHRYSIAKSDLIPFLERYSERHKVSLLPPVERHSKTSLCTASLSGNIKVSLHDYYSHLLESEKDVLRVSDVCRITGYGKTAVNNWFLSGSLIYVVVKNAKHTSKESLINFMSSDTFDKIYRKSAWHLEQIAVFRSRMRL